MRLIDRFFRLSYYLLFFVTPILMFHQTSEIFEFNKMLFIYFITICVISLWIVKSIYLKKFFFKRTKLDIIVLLFLITQILSTVFSIDQHTSIFGYYGRFNGGLISILSYLILYYGFVANYFEEKNNTAINLLKTSIFSSFVVILWSLPDKFGYDLTCLIFTGDYRLGCWTSQFQPQERAFSTLGQPNWLAAYLVINFFIGLFFLIKSNLNKNKSRFFYLIYLILNFGVILFTKSKTGLIALTVCFIVFLVWFLAKKNSLKILDKKILISLFFGFLLAILFFKTGISQIDNLLNFKKTQINNNVSQSVGIVVTDSFDIRKIVWQGAWELGLGFPIFGTGLETFAYSYYFVRPISHNTVSEWDFIYNKAHNEYLNYLANSGFIGLFFYLLFIFTVIYFFIKKILSEKKDIERVFYISLFLGWFSILITNFTGFSTSVINLYFYILPAFLFLEEVKNNQEILSHLNKFQKILTIIPFVIFVFGTNYLLNYLIADINYNFADTYTSIQEYDLALSSMEKALSLRQEHVYYDRISNIYANLAYISAFEKSLDKANYYYKMADFYNLKSLQESPANIFYWKTKAKNYYIFYQLNSSETVFQAGIQALQTAQKIAPNDPKVPHSLGRYYELKIDNEKDVSKKQELFKKAEEYYLNAIKLKNNYYDAYFSLGQLYKQFGEIEKSNKYFQYILDKFSPNDPNVLKEMETK